eukprot:2269352-Amphidinium_carterae.1
MASCILTLEISTLMKLGAMQLSTTVCRKKRPAVTSIDWLARCKYNILLTGNCVTDSEAAGVRKALLYQYAATLETHGSKESTRVGDKNCLGTPSDLNPKALHLAGLHEAHTSTRSANL